MAVYKQNIVDIELTSGNVHRSFLKHSIGTADNKADRFGVRVFRDGVAEDLTDVTVQGYFRDPRGNNIAITSGNSVEGNLAEVVLPQACYNYEGQFTLSIKLIGGGVTGTMRIVDGMVDNTNTGSAVAPTGAVPTYQEVLASYDEAIAAVETVTAMGSKIDEIALAEFCPTDYSPTLTRGSYIAFSTGKATSSNNYARTGLLYGYGTRIAVNFVSSTYEYNIFYYDSTGAVSSGTGYLGHYPSAYTSGMLHIPAMAVLFGLSFRRVDRSALSDADVTAIKAALTFYTPADTTLTKKGMAADAKVTGDTTNEIKNTLKISSADMANGYSYFDVPFVQGSYGGSVGGQPSLNTYSDRISFGSPYTANTDITVEVVQKSSGTIQHNVMYLNDNGTIKSVKGWTSASITIPSGSKFYYMLDYTSDLSTGEFLYLHRYKNYVGKAADSTNEILSLMNITVSPTSSDIIDNKFVQSDGQNSPTASGYKCTDYLDISGIISDKIEISCTIYGNASMVLYDSTKAVLMYINGNNASTYGLSSSSSIQKIKIDRPVNAKYARLSAYSGYSAPSDLYVKGLGFGDLNERVSRLEQEIDNIEIETLTDKKVLVIGDSISTDSYGNYKKWVTDLIEEGFFTESLVNNNSQHATGFVARYNDGNNRFIDRLSAVANKDTYDLVVIYGGTNDYIQNIPMGTDNGDKDTEFIPAVRYLMDYAIKNFTQARICIISPTRTYATWTNTQGRYETEYFSKIREIAKEFCYPTLNLTEESGFAPFISAFRNMWTYYVSGYDYGDGVHPNQEYEKTYLSPIIKHFLISLLH